MLVALEADGCHPQGMTLALLAGINAANATHAVTGYTQHSDFGWAHQMPAGLPKLEFGDLGDLEARGAAMEAHHDDDFDAAFPEPMRYGR